VSDTPKTLNPAVPTDAAEILSVLIGKIRMDGLTGGECAALFQSIDTLRTAVAPKPESDRG
jgi:hypothetical protein